MRPRLWLVSVALFAVGLLVGVLSPSLKAQTAADPCAAPWEVTAVASRPTGAGQVEGGAVILKYNRCTGAAFVLSFDGPMLEQDDKNAGTLWRQYPTEGAK